MQRWASKHIKFTRSCLYRSSIASTGMSKVNTRTTWMLSEFFEMIFFVSLAVVSESSRRLLSSSLQLIQQIADGKLQVFEVMLQKKLSETSPKIPSVVAKLLANDFSFKKSIVNRSRQFFSFFFLSPFSFWLKVRFLLAIHSLLFVCKYPSSLWCLFCYFLIQVHGKRSVMMMNLLSQSQPTENEISALNRAAQKIKKRQKQTRCDSNWEGF